MAQTTTETPPQVDPELLFEAAGLGEGDQLAILSNGCAVIRKRFPGEAKIIRDNSVFTGDCKTGLVDGPIVSSKYGKINGYWMGKQVLYRVNGPLSTVKSNYRSTYFYPKEGGLQNTITSLADGDQDLMNDGKWGISFLSIHDGTKVVASIAKYAMYCSDLAKGDWKKTAVYSSSDIKQKVSTALSDCKRLSAADQDKVYVSYYSVDDPANPSEKGKHNICAVKAREQEEVDQAECDVLWRKLAAPWKDFVENAWTVSKAQDAQTKIWADDMRINLAGRIDAVKAGIAARQEAKARRFVDANFANMTTFLETPAGQLGRKATKPFAVPTGGAGVIVTGYDSEYSGGLSIDFDMAATGAVGEAEVIQAGEVDKASLAAAIGRLKAKGASTVYIVDLAREDSYTGATAARSSEEQTLVSSTVSDNPEYARLTRDLQQARRDEAAAKVEYDQMNAKANSGGYGTGAAAAIGMIDVVSKSNKYSDAQNRRISLENQLAGSSAQTTNNSYAILPTGQVDMQSRFVGLLPIIACDVVTAMCAEKVKPVAIENKAVMPLVVIKGSSNSKALIDQANKAFATLEGDEKARSFGITPEAMGNFVAGTGMRLPMGSLAEYINYSGEQFLKVVKADFAADVAQNNAVALQLAPVAVKLRASGVGYNDPTGLIGQAEEAASKAERQKGLQTLN